MSLHGQVFRLKRVGQDRAPVWAFRYRLGGRGSKRFSVAGSPRSGTRRRLWSGSWSGCAGSCGSRDRSPSASCRGVPLARRCRAGDDGEAALAAGEGGCSFRRATGLCHRLRPLGSINAPSCGAEPSGARGGWSSLEGRATGADCARPRRTRAARVSARPEQESSITRSRNVRTLRRLRLIDADRSVRRSRR
jgi:hypothetical protein